MCVYICAHVYICFWLCMYVYDHVCKTTRCVHRCMYLQVSVYGPLCDFVHTYISIHERVCVYECLSTCGNVLVHFLQWDLFFMFQEVIYFLICELYECRTAKWSQNIIRNYWVEEWEDEKVWILTLWYQNVTIW